MADGIHSPVHAHRDTNNASVSTNNSNNNNTNHTYVAQQTCMYCKDHKDDHPLFVYIATDMDYVPTDPNCKPYPYIGISKFPLGRMESFNGNPMFPKAPKPVRRKHPQWRLEAVIANFQKHTAKRFKMNLTHSKRKFTRRLIGGFLEGCKTDQHGDVTMYVRDPDWFENLLNQFSIQLHASHKLNKLALSHSHTHTHTHTHTHANSTPVSDSQSNAESSSEADSEATDSEEDTDMQTDEDTEELL